VQGKKLAEVVWQSCNLIADPAGSLYVLGREDGTLDNQEPMFLIKGTFKTGQAGTALLTSGDNWVSWEVTGDSLVSCKAPGVRPPMPAGLLTLDRVLGVLESAGHVRVKIMKHSTAERNPAAPGKFTVTRKEVAVLQPTVSDSGPANAANFSSFVSVAALKTCADLVVAHRLDFTTKDKTLTCDYPGVFLKKPVNLRAGELVQLTFASAALPAAPAAPPAPK
jgi:hypothetical protein